MGFPFMASAPPHSQSLTLPHLPSKDHHFLCFQRPFLTAAHPLQSWLKRLPLHHREEWGRSLFGSVQLLAVQPLGKKVHFLWA